MTFDWFELAIKILVLLFFAIMIMATGYYAYVSLFKAWVAKAPVRVLANFVTTPTISILVVVLFNYTAGNIEIEGLGFKFKGASGPVIFWILCFISTTWGMSKLNTSEVNKG